MTTFTAPKSWTSGEILTASSFNTHLRDNLKALTEAKYIVLDTTESPQFSNQVTLATAMAAPPAIGGTTPAAGTFSQAAVSGASGTSRLLMFRTNGLARWDIRANASAEAGSNLGSNLAIGRYSDAGVLIDDVLNISRNSGNINVFKLLSVVSTAGPARLAIDTISAGDRQLSWTTNTVPRWMLGANANAESGSNAGSDFVLNRYNDAGVLIDAPLTISRTNAAMTLAVSSLALSSASAQLNVSISAPAGQNKGLQFFSGSTLRWWIVANSVAESGSNAGSNLEFLRYADNGTLLSTALWINRATGAVTVTGALSKGSGTFLIDHPLYPTDRKLYHGFVEAPRYDLIYRGTVTLNDGHAEGGIDAASNMSPGTWAALCKNAQVYFQNQTGFARVRGEITPDGRVLVECEDPTSTDIVSWLVVAERNDPFIHDSQNHTDETGSLIPEWEKEDAFVPDTVAPFKGELLHEDAVLSARPELTEYVEEMKHARETYND